ncbi:MAG: hypothetical protein COV59_02660 [Candidatus Magasanikbacteria bacterium CG11_big_fil_rev_8_21_14_0_20_39_34]|uniref:Uncharacterized protein n=1 Tax=Candidatus Magasanikbacteria bacterium CG11_big_fil_rev_8_21_14_0_20_39_34 TaxID=1974653 RepID=A0A2H0N597_9BACT|nr:MAG: hypothetical protein COV59_02660 [Candidatus Magasanikbacteria bacterium CG11_big_fil_rev_8_21_14_0_20_39_34]
MIAEGAGVGTAGGELSGASGRCALPDEHAGHDQEENCVARGDHSGADGGSHSNDHERTDQQHGPAGAGGEERQSCPDKDNAAEGVLTEFAEQVDRVRPARDQEEDLKACDPEQVHRVHQVPGFEVAHVVEGVHRGSFRVSYVYVIMKSRECQC